MPDPRRSRPELNALVRELLDRLASSDVRELEVRRNGLRVKVSRAVAVGGTAVASAPAPVPTGPVASAAASPTVVVEAGSAAATAPSITAPLTGVFYRAPSPQAAPFVQAGTVVGKGDVIALIEAMKLFNEIRSDKSGVVRRVLVENGQLVKKHQPLYELDPV